MKNMIKVLVASLSLVLIGCSDDETPVGSIRVIHTVPDAPAVNILLNGSAKVSNLDYEQSSGYTQVDEDTYEVSV